MSGLVPSFAKLFFDLLSSATTGSSSSYSSNESSSYTNDLYVAA